MNRGRIVLAMDFALSGLELRCCRPLNSIVGRHEYSCSAIVT